MKDEHRTTPTRTLNRAKPKYDAIRAALVQHARPEGISCKEIAELTKMSQGYVCSVMRRLERDGDARIASYGISPAGLTGQGGAACAFWAPTAAAQAET